MVTMPKGKMTLEKLAGMVQQGFTSIENSFNQRIDALAAELRERLDRLEGRMDSLETEIAAIRRQLNNAVYQPELHAIERRIVTLERKAGIRTK